jgi:zinc protease
MISIEFDKFTLSNGLDVILSRDDSLPVTSVNLWYHVGSKNEDEGKTGFAHLFEHVMFEGSKNHDSSFFEPLLKVGANLNGSTTPDRTNYWVDVPSNYLELLLWLESDRMGYLLEVLTDRKLDVQRDVVKNERRQNYENRPYGMAHMLLQPAVFPAPHPYNWTTIGSPEDLDNASLDDVKSFFRRFYTPNNASLAIVGDFDPDEARSLVEKYFGDIPPGPYVERALRMDSSLSGALEITSYDRVQLPRLYMTWPTVPAFSDDQTALDILAAILGDGRSSRLYRSLVYEQRSAREVQVYHHDQEIAGEFIVQATANPEHSLDELESELLRQLEDIRSGNVSERELERARNRIQASHVFQLERSGGFGGRADQLNYYNTYTGDPEFINKDLDRYMAVTVEDVRRAAGMLDEARVKLSIHPEADRTASQTKVKRDLIPAAAAPPSFTAPVPNRAQLDNGLNILHVERRGIPTVAFGLVIRSGSADDAPDRAGIAHLTTTMLREGTATRDSGQISDEMEFLGSQIRAVANREHILITSDGLTSTWRDTLAVLGDVAMNPAFPEHELERIRANTLTDLRRVSDNPATISARATRGVMFGPGSPYGHPQSGSEDSVSAVTRSDLQAYFDAHFDPGAATFIIVGDLSLDEAIEAANDTFGGWRASSADTERARAVVAPPEPSSTTIYLADKPGAAQSVVRTGHLTISRNHPDYLAFNLFNYIFGGQFSARLNMNLRQDKGYSYGYMSTVDWNLAPSMLVAGGGVQTAVTKETVIETLKEFEEIVGERPVTEDEFTDAVQGLLRSMPAQFETQSRIVAQLTRMVAYDLPDDYLARLPDSLAQVNLEDVRRVASELLDVGHLNIVIAGDATAVEPGLRELGLPIVHIDYEGREVAAS